MIQIFVHPQLFALTARHSDTLTFDFCIANENFRFGFKILHVVFVGCWAGADLAQGVAQPETALAVEKFLKAINEIEDDTKVVLGILAAALDAAVRA